MVKDAFIKYDESSMVAPSSPWGIFFMLSPRYSKKKKKTLGRARYIARPRTRSHDNDNVMAKWGGLIALSRSVSRLFEEQYCAGFVRKCTTYNVVHVFTKIFAKSSREPGFCLIDRTILFFYLL